MTEQRTLLAKLTLVLAVLMLTVGVFVMLLTLSVNRAYLQEMQQRINREVAPHIVDESILLRDGEIDHDGLKNIFHMMMVIHPSIELYLLDTQGRILAYSAPEGKVKAERVELAPLHAFLAGDRLPILGDDPRHPGEARPFSAAEVRGEDGLEGYLYIVVGGEPFASAVSQLTGSYSARLGFGILALGQLLALLTGFLMVRWIVRRLSRLQQAMGQFAASGFREVPPFEGRRSVFPDEIDRLRATFEELGERMTSLLDEIDRADAQRRELIASISHDLRTPLASIRGYLETLTLKGDSLSAAERRSYVEIAERQGARLQKLIDDLFELSKLDAGQVQLQREPFSMAELVQDVVQKFSLEAARRKIRLETEIVSDPPRVHADLALIERVLSNLLENALKYTDAGGVVSVSTAPNEAGVAVSVHDSGCGIPGDELPRIFDRFYRGRSVRDGEREGSGLGLAIAARILDLHAATFDAASKPGDGTTIRFVLPESSAAPPM